MTLQVLGLFRYPIDQVATQQYGLTLPRDNATGRFVERELFDIVCTDGRFKTKCLLDPKLNSMALRGQLQPLILVRVSRWGHYVAENAADDDPAMVTVIHDLDIVSRALPYDPRTDFRNASPDGATAGSVAFPSGAAQPAPTTPARGSSSSSSSANPRRQSLRSQAQADIRSPHTLPAALEPGGRRISWYPKFSVRNSGCTPLLPSRALYYPLSNEDCLSHAARLQPPGQALECSVAAWSCFEGDADRLWREPIRVRWMDYVTGELYHFEDEVPSLAEAVRLAGASMSNEADGRTPVAVGRVLARSKLISYSRPGVKHKTPFKYEMLICDSSCTVRVVVWNSKACESYSFVELGDVLRLEGFRVKRYQNMDELSVNESRPAGSLRILKDAQFDDPILKDRLEINLSAQVEPSLPEELPRVGVPRPSVGRDGEIVGESPESLSSTAELRGAVAERALARRHIVGVVVYVGPRKRERAHGGHFSEYRMVTLWHPETPGALVVLHMYANSQPEVFVGVRPGDPLLVTNVLTYKQIIASNVPESLLCRVTVESLALPRHGQLLGGAGVAAGGARSGRVHGDQ